MKRVAILTNFMEFIPGYSLTGIVTDQVEMLIRNGHEVHLYVNAQFHGKPPVIRGSEGKFFLHPSVPFAHLKDYSSRADITAEHVEVVGAFTDMLVREMPENDLVFTHDMIFTGWNLPYALGIINASQQIPKPGPAWLHWIHSVPSRNSDWWAIQEYGTRHKLVYPNKTDSIRVAEQYKGWPENVLVIPHIKDLRTWFEFSEETYAFIDQFPEVMQNDVVQVLPASVDRLKAKRVKEVILTFAKLKERGLSVCLVVANQWATQTQQKQDVEHYIRIARRNNLGSSEVIFTSKFQSPKYDAGIPRRMLRELSQCSNLFLFPTREESFGLVVPEASLSGGVLLVLNKSLQQQIEISGYTTLYFDFGSFHQNFEPANWDTYLKDVAALIHRRLQYNESILSKTYMRKTYNMDHLYRAYYGPIFSESELW